MIPAQTLRFSPDEVLAFWQAAGPSRWFRKDGAFDAEFRTLFLNAHEAAARGGLEAWQGAPGGSLALVLLLDQFPGEEQRFLDAGGFSG